MQTPVGRKLVHLYSSDYDKLCHIGFVDYTGHRAKGGGCHFTATHKTELTEAELYEILKPHLRVGPANEPDLVACDGCGDIHFSDELDVDFESASFECLCRKCGEARSCQKN